MQNSLMLAAALFLVPVSEIAPSPNLNAPTVEVPVEEIKRVRTIILLQQQKINDLQNGLEMWRRAATKFRCA